MDTEIRKPLTWTDLANLYDKAHSGNANKARTLPTEIIFGWAEKQADTIFQADNGNLYLKD